MAPDSSFIPSSEEFIDIIIAVVALSIGFTLALTGGLLGGQLSSFWTLFPIAIVAIIISFPLHEYMHKIVAQRYGAVAAFRRSDTGIIFTLLTGALGFLFGMPGATVIYTNHFTVKEEGVVSIAGPITNFVIFGIFYAIWHLPMVAGSAYLSSAVQFILYINLWLAFFNMLPLYPLDGSKVLRWNKGLYAAFMIIIVVLLFVINASLDIIFTMIFAFILALVMSRLSRRIMVFN